MTEQKNDFELADKAREYAIKTTSTRCHLMGECCGKPACPLGVKSCDFRSRWEAYAQGASDAMDFLCAIPWDKAMEALFSHSQKSRKP